MAPNMNPERNHCLKGDYVEGERLMGQCYSFLLSRFWEIVTGTLDEEAASTAQKNSAVTDADIDEPQESR